MADHVIHYARNAIEQTEHMLFASEAHLFTAPEAVIAWAKQEKCTEIVTAYAPVGPVADVLSSRNHAKGRKNDTETYHTRL